MNNIIEKIKFCQNFETLAKFLLNIKNTFVMEKEKMTYGYLAPLNYDKFFKKVFKEPMISKQFLEDFLGIDIKDINIFERESDKLTDASKVVKFDYRCQIDKEENVIIEMQQWYKADIVQRFLIYHALNISLQLENMPEKTILIRKGEKKTITDYRRLTPSITLIWLVDDSLGMEDNFISYSMFPDKIADFIRNSDLWDSEEFAKLKNKRDELLKILDSKKRELDFLQSNKLIFILQKQIVKNIKLLKEDPKKNANLLNNYNRWFDFAEKTRNFSNKVSDFSAYNEDAVFSEMIKRLATVSMDNKDLQYIKSTKKTLEGIKRYEEGFYKYGFIDGEKKGMQEGIEKEKKRSERIINKAEIERKKEKVKREKAELERKKAEFERKKEKEKREKAELQFSIFKYYFTDKKTVDTIVKITGKTRSYIKNILGL